MDPKSDADRPELADWLVFQRAAALRPERAVDWLRSCRDPGGELRRGADRLRAKREPGDPMRPERDPARDIADLAQAGARALPFGWPGYPERLAALTDPPPLLLVRGDVAALRGTAVAIVGSRAATVYGKRVARQLASELARAGVVVVSGLARGIDAEAHRGALDAGGTTVAVLACGIDLVYPREHRALATSIAETGAVISELPVATPPLRPFFPMRNRLISGLASALVVVEARERSGSLITALHAANQGRDVFAVPGPITAPTSAGTNRLLRDGACVALGSADVLRELGLEPARVAEPVSTRTSEFGSAILSALRHAPASRDELSRRLGRAPEKLASELMQLELDGCVAEDRDGRLHVLAGPK